VPSGLRVHMEEDIFLLKQKGIQVKLTVLAKPITSNDALAHKAQGQKLRKELHDLLLGNKCSSLVDRSILSRNQNVN
jgi:hypothetical protein